MMSARTSLMLNLSFILHNYLFYSLKSLFFFLKHLLEDEGFGVIGEPLRVQVMQTTRDSVEVSRPHVLDGIHPESGHAHVDQFVHEVGHLVPNKVLLQSQIQQTDQTTVTHLEP